MRHRGDIDTLYIHLYMPLVKGEGGIEVAGSKNDVCVVFQKPGGKFAVYNVTALLILLEEKLDDRRIGTDIAFSLCLGLHSKIIRDFTLHDLKRRPRKCSFSLKYLYITSGQYNSKQTSIFGISEKRVHTKTSQGQAAFLQ